MRVLLLNWRDVMNPRGGGAERVTHEVARRLVERAYDVTWLAAQSPGLAEEEFVDGVRIVRRGSELTTRLHAPRLAREIRPDVVLEEINTLPYFAPLWARAPVLLYMNQLARDVWWYEAPPYLAAFGWAAEPCYLQAYRHCTAITISLSSRDDLRRVGIRRPIVVAPMAVDVGRAATLSEKRLSGALIAIGRLTPSKRFDHAIRALAELRERYPSASLTIVGDGRCREALEKLAADVGAADAVTITGRVDEHAKIRLIDEADVLVGTSVREGWGLTVTEAAARGVPSVTYDVPGFRDSVVPDRTGLLVRSNPEALAKGLRRLIRNSDLYERMRMAAWEAATNGTFSATADSFESALAEAVSRPLRRRN